LTWPYRCPDADAASRVSLETEGLAASDPVCLVLGILYRDLSELLMINEAFLVVWQ
jgi:hypothetical protein